MQKILGFLSDFIMLPASFGRLAALVKKKKGYVAAFLVLLLALMTLTEARRTMPALTDFIKGMDSIEITQGTLLINGGEQDYAVNIAGTPFRFVYEPAREFPPVHEDFVKLSAVAIATKTQIYMPRGAGGVQSRTLGKSLTVPSMNGQEFVQSYPSFFMALDIAVFLAIFFTVMLTILYWITGSFFLIYLLQSFMLKKLPRYALIKLAVFVQSPVFFVLLISRLLNFEIPLFNIAQLCITGLYAQQALNHYPKLKIGDLNVTKS